MINTAAGVYTRQTAPTTNARQAPMNADPTALLAHIDAVLAPDVPPVADISHVLLSLAGDVGVNSGWWDADIADKRSSINPSTVDEFIAARQPGTDPFFEVDILTERADSRLNRIWDAAYGPADPFEPAMPGPAEVYTARLDGADATLGWASAYETAPPVTYEDIVQAVGAIRRDTRWLTAPAIDDPATARRRLIDGITNA